MNYAELKCEACGVHMAQEPLFRNGPKGPGCDPHWRCKDCSTKPIAPITLDVVEAIAGRRP